VPSGAPAILSNSLDSKRPVAAAAAATPSHWRQCGRSPLRPQAASMANTGMV